MTLSEISIQNEFSTLKRVILGLGSPYQRDREKVAAEMQEFPLVPNTARKEQVLALTYPTEEQLIQEYAEFTAVLKRYGTEVLLPDSDAAYSFDYTCPRDIGFVIGDTFFIASMAVESRSDEYKTILSHLEGVASQKIVRVPDNVIIEGGDVIVWDECTVLVGINTRTSHSGFRFLKEHFAAEKIDVYPIPHKQLHLDCCLNPLGLGHLLIHPESLESNLDEVWQVLKSREWITVDSVEREHLATNILSINHQTVIARNEDSCSRVNQQLRDAGYIVEELQFDGVPATGGSFRCASLALLRIDE